MTTSSFSWFDPIWFTFRLVFLGLGIWIAVDASRYPDQVWQRAGHNKLTWQILPIVAGLLCSWWNVVPVLVYFTSTRKTLDLAASGHGPVVGFGAPPYGSGYGVPYGGPGHPPSAPYGQAPGYGHGAPPGYGSPPSSHPGVEGPPPGPAYPPAGGVWGAPAPNPIPGPAPAPPEHEPSTGWGDWDPPPDPNRPPR